MLTLLSAEVETGLEAAVYRKFLSVRPGLCLHTELHKAHRRHRCPTLLEVQMADQLGAVPRWQAALTRSLALAENNKDYNGG